MIKILRSALAWLTGIIILVVFFPVSFIIWIITLPFDRNRKVMHRILVLQSIILVRIIPFWKLKIEGKEKIPRGRPFVMISNHSSLADILMINCLGCNFKWISKIENTRVPVLGWYLRMADYITVDRDDEESKITMLARSLVCLRNGISLMIFPEGTRSTGNTPGFFKRGAFQLAIEAGVPLLPLVLKGTGDLLPKHGFILGDTRHIVIRVLDPVYPESFETDDAIVLGERFRNMISSALNKIPE
jgi:1-acyl-sn-glycerol-3-phosphate acyltransferase